MRWLASTLAMATILLTTPHALWAQTAAQTEAAYNQLAQAFKPVLIGALPSTLHEKTENWGHQVNVPTGLRWRGIRPEVTKSPRNHGEWRKLVISAQDLKNTLHMRIYDVKSVNKDKQSYKVLLAFQMGVYYDQQNWESGIRLISGSVRARAQVKVHMNCENTLKIDLDKQGLPDIRLRLRVTGATIEYDNLVVEHINGIGGDGAKIVGRAVHQAMKQWRPSLERDILAKASAAIVRAADTREIRFGFGSLLASK